MTPEEKARVKIDQMFDDAGWKVVDRDFYSPTFTAVAIREGLLEGNHEADYFLLINGKKWMSPRISYVTKLSDIPVTYLSVIRHMLVRFHLFMYLMVKKHISAIVV